MLPFFLLCFLFLAFPFLSIMNSWICKAFGMFPSVLVILWCSYILSSAGKTLFMMVPVSCCHKLIRPWYLCCSLVIENVLGSTFLASVLESSISLKSPGFFYCALVLGVFIVLILKFSFNFSPPFSILPLPHWSFLPCWFGIWRTREYNTFTNLLLLLAPKLDICWVNDSVALRKGSCPTRWSSFFPN